MKELNFDMYKYLTEGRAYNYYFVKILGFDTPGVPFYNYTIKNGYCALFNGNIVDHIKEDIRVNGI